jgi:hypothetical protein
MTKGIRLYLSIVLVLIVLDLIGVLIPAYHVEARRQSVVADVLERTEAYIARTNGKWPQSWDDLGLVEDEVGGCIRLDFTLEPETATIEDVRKAVKIVNIPHGTFWPVMAMPPQQGIDKVYSAMCKARDRKP